MPITLIEQNPTFSKKVEGSQKLAIAEMFADTLQGEGISTGVVSTFIRLQGCTLKCNWCDTLSVWPNGNEYSFDEIFSRFEDYKLIEKFQKGQHLVLTGGSPLMQQNQLIDFLCQFFLTYKFHPYVEVENECVLDPNVKLINMVDQWNNSPKLANSGMKTRARYKPILLKQMSNLDNSWFKFVVKTKEDWKEIEEMFLPFIKREQIILMPEGQTQVELNYTRELCAELAIEQGVRFSDRLHITIWDKKTGV